MFYYRYINAFFSYNETIDIYYTILLLSGKENHPVLDKNTGLTQTEGDEDQIPPSKNKRYLAPKFDNTNMVFKNKESLYWFIDKCQEGLEMDDIPLKESMLALYLLQMGLYSIEGDDSYMKTYISNFDIKPTETRLIKSRYISKLLWCNRLNYEKINTKESEKYEWK